MIMRLYQATSPSVSSPANTPFSPSCNDNLIDINSNHDHVHYSNKRRVLQDLELNKDNFMPEKIRPQSEKNSITKKLINFKQASIFPSKALTDLNMHRDDTISLSHSEENYNRNISGSSKLLESEQPSNLITAAGNKYNAIKNCLNTIKDTFTKGGESLHGMSPQLLSISSLSNTLGLTEDTPHESLQCALKAQRSNLMTANHKFAQNFLATGEPQQQIYGNCTKELAEMQKQLDQSRDEIKTLVSSKRDALDVFKQLREKYDSLRLSRKTALEQLAILKHQNSELQERFEKEKKLREKEYKETIGLRRALDSLRATSDHLKRSNESLLRQLRGSHVDVEELRASVEETKERLKCSEHQLQLCDAEIKRRDASRNELIRQNIQYAELQKKCEKLESALREAGEADEERCRRMEQEIVRLKTASNENQKQFEREKRESNTILQELNASIITHKEKIKELSGIVVKQDSLIQEQLQAIEQQENQLKEIQQTSETAKRRAEILEEKLSEAEERIRLASNSSEVTAQYESHLKELRKELDNTRDTLLIKDKIIEDQVGTIQNLKTALGEKSTELQKLSAQRDREKSKYKLALGDLQTRKPMSGNLIQQRQKMGFQEEEQRAACKQLLLLRREKDHAVFTAHYVTKQLIQTVSEFEKQVATQRKVHRMLISVLGEKEKMLNKITNSNGDLLSRQLELRNQAEDKQRQEIMTKALTVRDTCVAVLNKLPTAGLNLEKLSIQ